MVEVFVCRLKDFNTSQLKMIPTHDHFNHYKISPTF